MYSCLAELREIRRDLSRRTIIWVTVVYSRASWHSSLGPKGVGSKPLHVQLLQKLQPRPVDHLFQCECSDDLKKPHSAQSTVHSS